jgi:hypothetical protein
MTSGVVARFATGPAEATHGVAQEHSSGAQGAESYGSLGQYVHGRHPGPSPKPFCTPRALACDGRDSFEECQNGFVFYPP